MSRKEIEENSPSRLDGIDLKKETYLREAHERYLKRCYRLTPEQWNKRSPVRRVAQNIARLVSPLL